MRLTFALLYALSSMISYIASSYVFIYYMRESLGDKTYSRNMSLCMGVCMMASVAMMSTALSVICAIYKNHLKIIGIYVCMSALYIFFLFALLVLMAIKKIDGHLESFLAVFAIQFSACLINAALCVVHVNKEEIYW